MPCFLLRFLRPPCCTINISLHPSHPAHRTSAGHGGGHPLAAAGPAAHRLHVNDVVHVRVVSTVLGILLCCVASSLGVHLLPCVLPARLLQSKPPPLLTRSVLPAPAAGLAGCVLGGAAAGRKNAFAGAGGMPVQLRLRSASCVAHPAVAVLPCMPACRRRHLAASSTRAHSAAAHTNRGCGRLLQHPCLSSPPPFTVHGALPIHPRGLEVGGAHLTHHVRPCLCHYCRSLLQVGDLEASSAWAHAGFSSS